MSKEDDKYLGKVGGGQFTEDKEENVEAVSRKFRKKPKELKKKLLKPLQFLTNRSRLQPS